MTDVQTGVVIADTRGRVSLGHPSKTYKRSELADGTIVLEPANVVSELEDRVRANAALSAYLRLATERTDLDVPRPKRRSRA